jgi:uncharacterized protein YbdZ (MbtH family)
MGGGKITPKEAAAFNGAPADTALPAGWEQVTSSERLYFVDHNTHTTTFQDPRKPLDPNIPPPNISVTLEGDPLPAGWKARRLINSDGSEGRLYFVNHNKRENSWEDPRLGLDEKREEDVKEKGELPKGWEVKWSEAGRKYFVNHNEKKTTWDDPRGVANSSGAAA